MFVEWRRMERQGLRVAQQARAPLYERTGRFWAYSPSLVPGMIQTPEYIEQVLRNAQQRRHLPDDVDQAVAVRLERQQLLTEGNRVFAFLIEEPVLYSDIATPSAMAGQLRYLLEVARRPNVGLGIVPMRLRRTQRLVEGFWIYDNAQVNVELVAGYLTVTAPSEIKQYAQTFAELAGMAVYGATMRRIINAAIDALS